MTKPAFTVAVTGGAGFLGSHLCERLVRQGHDVYCFDNFLTGSRANLTPLLASGRLTIIGHDVRDPILGTPRFDEIYNLACPASPPQYQTDPLGTLAICSEGTRNVLERARRDNARLFHASTSEVYGDPEVHPQVESYNGNVHSIGPRACYDEGKRFAETLVSLHALQYRVDAKIARIFNTFGPRMQVDDGRVISNFVVQALSGQPITLYGDGSHTRSLCYVDDLVEGILRLMRSGIGAQTPVNLGNPVEMSVREIAKLVRTMSGSDAPIVQEALPIHDPQRRLPDIGLARRLLGWEPQVDFAEGLRRTIEYFRTVVPTDSGGEPMSPWREVRSA